MTQKSVGMVFHQLTAQLGHKVDDLYATAKPALVQREWAQGLFDFSHEEISRGVAACRGRVFAPTLGEFLHLCRPSLDGEIAWHEAEEGLKARRQGQHGEWSHPAVYRAACILSEVLRLGNFRANKNRWDHVLRTEFAKGFIEPVPPVRVAVENKPSTTTMPANIREQLQRAGVLVKRVDK